MSGPRLREAVRALVVDSDDRLVLVRFEFPGEGAGGDPRTVWAPPGGGLEAGEDDVACLRRELLEETGLELELDPGPPVWTRTHVVPLTGRGDEQWDGQTERIYLLRVDAFELRPALTADELRAEHVHDVRWWSPGELASASGVVFAPRRLPALLPRLLGGGLPSTPLDVGV
jgi:8-oxo-dGTP diphosphatase